MANTLMMRYAATRGRRMESEDGRYHERGIGNDEHGYPLPYREPRPEFGETEARYRGDDGRYKSGRRMGEMNDREKKWEFTVNPMDTYRMPGTTGTYDDDMEDNYEDPTGRVIGFNSFRNRYGGEQKHTNMNSHRGYHKMTEDGSEKIDRETAMEWVRNMKNEDPQHPSGGKWDVPVVKTMAKSLNIPEDSEEFWELYAVSNAMYSDYSKVLQKYGVTDPMAYAHLAKAWMHDKDAVENKTKVYYDCIVKHE